MSPNDKDSSELLARLEITQQLYRYCRGVDRGDLKLLQSVFHEDATDDHGIWKGLAQDFATFIVEALVGTSTSHSISNVLIEFEGDVAYCESYCLAVSEEPEIKRTVHSRNIDRFERRNGVWKIADRLVVFDVNRVAPQSPLPDMGDGITYGRRDREDPVYRGR